MALSARKTPKGSGDPHPGSRRPKPRQDLHLSLTEETYDFLKEQAAHYRRSLNGHASLIAEGVAFVQRQLAPEERDRLDALLRNPDRFLALLREGSHLR